MYLKYGVMHQTKQWPAQLRKACAGLWLWIAQCKTILDVVPQTAGLGA